MTDDPVVSGGSSNSLLASLLESDAEDLYENAPCGYLSSLPDGTFVKVNRTFTRWTGHRREDLVGHRHLQDLLTAGGRLFHETHLAPMLRLQGSLREVALDIVTADGARLPVLLNSVMLRDETGAPVMVRSTVVDATERRGYERELLLARRTAEHSERRVRLLHDVAVRLAAAVTLAEVAEVLVRVDDGPDEPLTAASLRLLAPGGHTLRTIASTAPGESEDLPVEAERPECQALAGGEVIVVEEASGGTAHVPLVIEGRALGVLSLVRAAGGSAEDDPDALSTLGRQAAQAVQRARLYETERRLRSRADLLQRCTARLAEATGPEDVEQVVRGELLAAGVADSVVLALLDLGGGVLLPVRPRGGGVPFPMGTALLRRLHTGRTSLRTSGPAGAAGDPAAADLLDAMLPGRRSSGATLLPLVVDGGVVGVLLLSLRAGEGEVDDEAAFATALAGQCAQALQRARMRADAELRARRTDVLARLSKALDEVPGSDERTARLVELLVPEIADEATVVPPGPADGAGDSWGAQGRVRLPLSSRGEVFGSLVLVRSEGRRSDAAERAFLRDLADRVALALDNARLYEQEREVASTLQRSLLAGSPPQDPRFGVASRYRPGVSSLEVGGDWYDVFSIDPDTVALVVGDVVGRGINAASTMGQLRSAVRAVAAPGVGPARLLERLDAFVDQVPAAVMATLVYAELSLDTGRMRYACAGHPPPVLVTPDGPAHLLWGGRSVPLGASLRPTRREEAVLDLPVGSELLLYTDGLVERREYPLDVGMDRLVAEVEGRRGVPIAVLAEGVSEAMLADERLRDDVCLLCVSFGVTPVFRRRLDVDLGQLTRLRSDLRHWLAGQSVDPADSDAVVLACSEAAANAIEHGYRGERGVVRIEASLDTEDVLHLSVADEGTWVDSRPRIDRGRGMTILNALMRQVVLQEDSGTTLTAQRQVRRRVRA